MASNTKSLYVNSQTMERSVNFTGAEVDRLQSLIIKHQNVLLCKKTDAISSKQKDSVWTLIESEFNALGEIPRTVKQLKYKFENIKRVAKGYINRYNDKYIEGPGAQNFILIYSSRQTLKNSIVNSVFETASENRVKIVLSNRAVGIPGSVSGRVKVIT